MNIFSTKKRFDIFDEHIKKNDFDDLLYKIILEHDDYWFEKYHTNGVEADVSNKIKFLFDYVEHYKKKKRIIINNNTYYGREFKDFYFIKSNDRFIIYNKSDNNKILNI